MPIKSSLAVEPDFNLEYTLDDLYKAFGGKVSLARRLKTALQKRNINTLEKFLSLTGTDECKWNEVQQSTGGSI